MKIIQDLVDTIDEEIEGAKCYAEKSLELKARGEGNWSNKYKEMASDELRHAMTIHDYAVQEIEILSRAYTPTVEMQEIWDKSHKLYVERVAFIKQMLSI